MVPGSDRDRGPIAHRDGSRNEERERDDGDDPHKHPADPPALNTFASVALRRRRGRGRARGWHLQAPPTRHLQVKAGRALIAGVRLRCPACRIGRMSRAWWSVLSMHERCPACGIPFMPGAGEFTGAVEGTTYLAALVGLLLFIFTAPLADITFLAIALWVVSFSVAFPLVAYRHMKGLWVGGMWALQPWSTSGDAPHVAPIEMPPMVWDA